MAEALPADPSVGNVFQMSAARLNEIGNLSVAGAQQNSERLSAMFGVRAAQANPVEASAISSLKASESPQNQGSNALVAALASMFANLARQTPTTNPGAG
jgi:hypothetical protein